MNSQMSATQKYYKNNIQESVPFFTETYGMNIRTLLKPDIMEVLYSTQNTRSLIPTCASYQTVQIICVSYSDYNNKHKLFKKKEKK